MASYEYALRRCLLLLPVVLLLLELFPTDLHLLLNKVGYRQIWHDRVNAILTSTWVREDEILWYTILTITWYGHTNLLALGSTQHP